MEAGFRSLENIENKTSIFFVFLEFGKGLSLTL